MTTIKILPHSQLCPEGLEFEALPGDSLCEALLDHHVNIEHACELSCACTTCHVVIKEGYAELEQPDENEEDLLDQAWGLSPTSRLSCQVKIGQNKLVIEIPKYTINHAKENH